MTRSHCMRYLLCAIAVSVGGPWPASAQPAGEKPKPFVLVGEIEPIEQARLHARIAGTVNKVHVDVGDRVRQGDILVALSVPEIDAEREVKTALLAQAEAELNLAGRSLRLAEATVAMTTAQVQEAEAGLQAAKAHWEFRKAAHERLARLVQQKAVEAHVVEEAKQHLNSAHAGVQEAEAKVKAAKAVHEGSRAKTEMVEAEIKVAQARIMVAKAERHRVEALLQSSRVMAPFDGIVARRNVAAGESVLPGGGAKAEPLLVIVRTDVVRVVVAVPEASLERIAVNASVQVTIPAVKNTKLAGKVTRIAPVLDSKTRTCRVEIDLPNADAALRPGMTAVVAVAPPAANEDKD